MSSPSVLPGDSNFSRQDAIDFLLALARAMQSVEVSFRSILSHIHPQFQVSALNLLHYLQLRSEDIRPLQTYLHECGLSSLTSSESHTLYQLLQVVNWLDREAASALSNDIPVCNFRMALNFRKQHTLELLGENSKRELPHVMVTLSPELAADKERIRQLLEAGMTVIRINCAHEGPAMWESMIKNVRDVSSGMNRPCKIYMDLGGPKIRITEVPLSKKRSHEGMRMEEGDLIELVCHPHKQRKAAYKRDGSLKRPARVVLQPPEIIHMMREGERIFFDDGKFEAKIIKSKKKSVLVQVTRISTRKPLLKASKGVNLPDSRLTISSLTEDDMNHLPFVAENADMVGYSFVNNAEDVKHLREQLAKFTTKPPAIILKIERLSAVQNLPSLLLEGMREKSFGVMIARGDLAVEIGFERLSEVQQEILWICEAAHVPVIWATQVLETMNKTGFATRSEITDAAMGAMAECVMLNKGKHVVKTVTTLLDILGRFTTHVDKKRFTFRPLSIAKNYLQLQKS